jgi:hypothetical protein
MLWLTKELAEMYRQMTQTNGLVGSLLLVPQALPNAPAAHPIFLSRKVCQIGGPVHVEQQLLQAVTAWADAKRLAGDAPPPLDLYLYSYSSPCYGCVALLRDAIGHALFGFVQTWTFIWSEPYSGYPSRREAVAQLNTLRHDGWRLRNIDGVTREQAAMAVAVLNTPVAASNLDTTLTSHKGGSI